ncbi:hypothetical protein Q3G72_034232 [Acer saccharum]|nr:hypothetical protein Q3G72_034232 [Acer saccharum]
MHIYGWPISVKVAAYGWNRRNPALDKKVDKDGRQVFDGRNRDNFNVEHPTIRSKQSFAAVVKEARVNTSASSEQLGSKVMSWRIQNEAEERLVRSAVGILKDYSDVSSVNVKLAAREGASSGSEGRRENIFGKDGGLTGIGLRGMDQPSPGIETCAQPLGISSEKVLFGRTNGIKDGERIYESHFEEGRGKKKGGRGEKSFFEKGKGGWIRKTRKVMNQNINTSLRINERRQTDQSRRSSSIYDTESSSDASSDNHFYRGECSFQMAARNQVGYGTNGLVNGPKENAVKNKEENGPSLNRKKEDALRGQQENGACSDGEVPISLNGPNEATNNKGPETKEQNAEIQKSESSETEFETESDRETEHRGLNLYVDVSGQGGGLDAD